MRLIYIDQNILGYLSEGKLSLPKIDDFEWVYSNEHFAEIERSGKLELLDCLDKIGARRLRIATDDKFKITNNWCLDDYSKTSEIYDGFVNTTKEPPKVDFDFVSLQSFFSGNKEAIQSNGVAKDFVSTIKGLTNDLFAEGSNDDLKKSCDAAIELMGSAFEVTLSEASEDIRPIQEMRKSIAGTDLSNIDETKGLVIDQIWERIKDESSPITKEQFFGKKPLPWFSNYEDYPLFLGIAQCYTVLNLIGYWPDRKISKISRIYGINSDASHVGHAAFCSALLSEDFRLCKKASAIYKYFDIDTVVCRIQVS